MTKSYLFYVAWLYQLYDVDCDGVGCARRRCSSSAPGYCQSRLEGFEGTGVDYAGVKFVPGVYGSWEKRLYTSVL